MNEYHTSIASDLLQSVDDNQDHCSLTITPTVLDGIKHFRFKEIRGGSRIFFRKGCTRLLLYFNTNKPHSFFCWQNTSCIRKPQVISREGGGVVRTPCTLPLDPPLEIKVEDFLKSLKPLKTCKTKGADGKPAQILKIEASPLPDIFAPVH